MNRKKLVSVMFPLISGFLAIASNGVHHSPIPAGAVTGQQQSFNVITAEELKTKIARKETITIIDVRDTKSYVASENQIQGSIHVRVRRLDYRLSMPPLKSVSRDIEVVTYCACPNDESSRQAAQILLASGFKHVYVLKGGWRMWLKVNGQIEQRPKAD